MIEESQSNRDLGVCVTKEPVWSKQTIHYRCTWGNKMTKMLVTSLIIPNNGTLNFGLRHPSLVRHSQSSWSNWNVSNVKEQCYSHEINPFMCDVSYQDRLISTGLLSILIYWHDYLDLLFFYNQHGDFSSDILPVRYPGTPELGRVGGGDGGGWGGGGKQEGQLPLLPFARRGKGGRSALWVIKYYLINHVSSDAFCMGKIMRCDLECDLIKRRCVCFHWQVNT